MDDKEWFKVENLDRVQKREISDYERGKKNSGNDFHSYRMLVNGEDHSNISSHNAVGDVAQNVAKYIRYCIKEELKDRQLCEIKMADLGGGCGFVANELAVQMSNHNIFSYDIAEDAAAYGRRNFPDVHFVTKGIQENDILEEGPFDTILAYEFYPFTRTDEWGYQKNYIQMCLKNLCAGGVLLIGLPYGKNIKNLMNNEKKLKNCFGQYSPHKILIPYSRIVTLCAGNLRMAKLVSLFMGLFRIRHYFLVFENKSG